MVTSSQEPRSKQDQLADDLRWTTDRGFGEIFKYPAKGDKTKYEVLASVVQRLEPERWEEDPTRALIVVVRKVVNRLLPDDDYPEFKKDGWRSRLSWREIGNLLCGLREDLPEKEDKKPYTYDDYVDIVKAQSGYNADRASQENFTRDVSGPFRKLLADKLLGAAEGRLAIEVLTPTVVRNINPRYIPRRHLHAEFTQAVNSGAKLIVLYGLPGMGKTTLAREMIAALPVPFVPEIGFTDGRIATESLAAALERCGIDTTIPVMSNEGEYLARLLAHNEKHPQYVLLDGLETTDDLAHLQLRNVHSTIIATCRYRGTRRLEGSVLVRVGRMNDGEARRMIAERPNRAINEFETGRLVRVLECHPLLIDFACALAAEQHLDPYSFCMEVRYSTPAVACRVQTHDGSSLSDSLLRVMSLVKDRDQLAYDLLAFFALLNFDQLPVTVLRSYAKWARPGVSIETMFKFALRNLNDFAVVCSTLTTGEDRTLGMDEEYYRMDDVTRGVLRVVLEDELLAVAERVFRLFVDEVQPGITPDGFNMSHEDFLISASVRRIVDLRAPGNEQLQNMIERFPSLNNDGPRMFYALKSLPPPKPPSH